MPPDASSGAAPDALLDALPSLLAREGKVAVLQRLIVAVVQHPEQAALRVALADQLDGVGLGAISPAVREVIGRLLEDPAIAAQPLAGAALGPAMATPAYQALVAAARAEVPPPDDAVAAWCHDALVVAARPRLVGFQPELEAVLAHLRRTLLDAAIPAATIPESGPMPVPAPLPFLCALARTAWGVLRNE